MTAWPATKSTESDGMDTAVRSGEDGTTYFAAAASDSFGVLR